MRKDKKMLLILLIVFLAVVIIVVSNRLYYNRFDEIHFLLEPSYDIAYNKGLASSPDHVTWKYERLQSRYRDALCDYLNTKLSLNDLDRELKENGFNDKFKFKHYSIHSGIHKYFMDRSKLDSDYVYLRNIVYIEKLNEEDMNSLKKNKIDMKMIESSYKHIINREHFHERDVRVSYLDEKSYLPMRTFSNDLVFFYGYNIEDDKSEDRLKTLNTILLKYEKRFTKELSSPVKIINIMDKNQWEYGNNRSQN